MNLLTHLSRSNGYRELGMFDESILELEEIEGEGPLFSTVTIPIHPKEELIAQMANGLPSTGTSLKSLVKEWNELVNFSNWKGVVV